MNQPTESEFLDDVGLKKPDRSLSLYFAALIFSLFASNLSER